jgi:zinc protease
MNHSIAQRALLVVLILGAASAVTWQPAGTSAAEAKKDPVAQAEAAFYDGIITRTLDNGLRIYLKPVPSSPVVTVMTAYKVGSADENLDATGLSHYLEHLMFKGTAKIMPGDIDRVTLTNGGANNAYTSEDYTVYHFDFASDRYPVALDIEADRMRNLVIDKKHEFEEEKGAVISELKRNEDTPWDLESKAIVPLVFGKENPYGHPVIGETAHVRGATAEIIKAHYDRWYHPNNAAIVISGGFNPDDALARIQKLFGPIPAGKLPPRKEAKLAERAAPVHEEIPSKFDVARMLMGFNTVKTGDPDFYPLEVLDSILSGGKTCRLYRRLVEKEQIANTVNTSNSTGRYPGWFAVQVEMLKGKDRAKGEAITLEELKRVVDEPVSAEELKRAKARMVAGYVFGRESVHGLADSIARGVTTNDLDYLKTYLTKIQAVTAEDVQKAARKYLDPKKRVVVWSVPQDKKGAFNPDGVPEAPSSSRRGPLARADKEPGAGKEFSLKDCRRVVLDNGLTLLLFENHRLPIVVADADVEHVRLLEPAGQNGVANMMGRLLDEGTAAHTGPQIAELIENVGGQLSMTATGGSVKVLTPDRNLGLKVLFECLTTSNFPKESLERERQRLLNEIDDTERQPDEKAAHVYRGLVYGKHPFARPFMGTRADVEKLSRADVHKFYQRLFVPNNTVVAIVGDFDSDQVVQEVKELTKGWKKTPLEMPDVVKVVKPVKFMEKVLTMPEAAQLHLYMGHVGIKRDNPDFYKLLVMDYVLGTGPGFTDRLSANLRDRQGLAYTVSANITSSAGLQPGLFTCYAGIEPENFAKVKKGFLDEIEKIRTKDPTAAEVDGAKKYLLGNLPFKFTTNGRIAEQLLNIERYHLGFTYLDDYRKAVGAVTPEDVRAMAAKYLDPEHMVLVAAGAIDQAGKVLPAPKGAK